MAGRSVATKLEWATGELFPGVEESGQYKDVSHIETVMKSSQRQTRALPVLTFSSCIYPFTMATDPTLRVTRS